MFSLIRRRFTYANVAMTLALVFAMTGGAYAAKHYLITSTKQISPKVLKALKGAHGPQGAAGPAGSQGPAGPAGKNGVNGKDGANGANGTSITSSAEPAGANCKAGGAKFVSASGTTYACNGENGQTGFTERLPHGMTETGDFSLFGRPQGGGGEGIVTTAINFNIPLAAPLGKSQVHFIRSDGMEVVSSGSGTEEVQSTKCLGSPQTPTAEPGNLCVYANSEGELNSVSSIGSLPMPAICPLASHLVEFCEYFPGSDATGFGLFTEAQDPAGALPGYVNISGTWAVTAE